MREFDVSTTFFALLAVAANVATLTILGIVLAGRASDRARPLADELRAALGRSGLALSATVAGVAALGSLYLSERLHLTPCELCWYQRIAMYPLAVILVVAAIRRDWGVRPYALTLSLVGPIISTYHYVEQRFPSLDAGSCDPTNPCTLTWVWKFSYVSIPFMALSGFVLVATVLLVATPPTEPPSSEPDGSDTSSIRTLGPR